MSEVGYVGGSLNFSRMYESREVKDARDISRSEKTEESPQITDEKRREAAIASGIKVGTVVNTTAGGFLYKNRFFGNDFFFEKNMLL